MRNSNYTESSKWQTRSNKGTLLWSAVGACLSLTLLSSSALAETCTASPDCKSMGYTEASCPDGGVKCPFGNYWFCGGGDNPYCSVKTCQVGDVLYKNKKCYSCQYLTSPWQIPIGIVFTLGKAVTLNDFGHKIWEKADTTCRNYNIANISGWRLPTKDELIDMYNSAFRIQDNFSEVIGGKYYVNDDHWSSTYDGSIGNNIYYWAVNPVDYDNTDNSGQNSNNSLYVRCVLEF